MLVFGYNWVFGVIFIHYFGYFYRKCYEYDDHDYDYDYYYDYDYDYYYDYDYDYDYDCYLMFYFIY